MAKKTEPTTKVVLERSYIIPLSRQTLKVPRYKKAKRAVNTVRSFIQQHMKSEEVKIGRHLNMKLWEHGMRNPPKKVKVQVEKDEKGKVSVELFGAPKEEKQEKKKEAKSDSKKTVVDAEAKVIKEDAKQAKPKEVSPKKETPQEVEKKEVKQLKKELPTKQHQAPKQASVSKKPEEHANAPKKK